MYRRSLFVICLGLVVCFGIQSASASIMNGNFSSAEVFNDGLGWESSDDFDILSSTNVSITGEKAFISNASHSNGLSTLFQWVDIPVWAHSFSFEISFMTMEEDALEEHAFPDWFEAYFLDDDDSLYDRLFLGYDSAGPYDPTTFDPIALIDLGGGVYQYKTIIDSLAGRRGTLFFELNDEPDGFFTQVSIDNVQMNPIPEPTTLLLLSAGLACLAGMRVRHEKNRSV